MESIVGDKAQAEPFLNKLYAAGILKRKLYAKVIFCPKFNSVNISVRYSCPFCKSFKIQKSSLIEHINADTHDVEENFLEVDRYICPKCKGTLKKIDVDHEQQEFGAHVLSGTKASTFP